MSCRRFLVNLDIPVDEMLYEVYVSVLEQNLPCFQTIKVKIVQFEPFESEKLTLAQKQDLADFLAAAMEDVGQYALGATRLVVSCMTIGERYLIRVQDDGVRFATSLIRQWWRFQFRGTLHSSKAIARRLHGTVRRYPAFSEGEVVELEWPTPQPFFSIFWHH